MRVFRVRVVPLLSEVSYDKFGKLTYLCNRAIVLLHEAGELDRHLMPLGKESILPAAAVRPDSTMLLDEAMRPGTVKRRQES